MNYSNRDSVPINYNDASYYQSGNISEQRKGNQNNKSLLLKAPYQNPESQSRLNYNSAPFIPTQQYLMKAQSDEGSDLLTGGPNYFQQGPQLTFGSFVNNMPNQYFVPYQYSGPNTGSPPNYWPSHPNDSHYRFSNVVLPPNMKPNQNVLEKTPEKSFSSNSVDQSSPIHTEIQKLAQKNDQKPQIIKQNSNTVDPSNTVDLTPELSQNDKKIIQYKNLKFSNTSADSDINNVKCVSLDQTTYKEIIESVNGDKTLKKQLSETLRNINPPQINLKSLTGSRFFVIKTYSEDDLHRSIKYGVWCSTNRGNQCLNDAYLSLQTSSANQNSGRLFLFFSVNGSGYFSGIAEMISPVDFRYSCRFWTQSVWVGRFSIKWHYIKDIRYSYLRHIRSEANENKPVTNSRDAVEVTPEASGIEFMKIFHGTKNETSLFDDFIHYEQGEMDSSSK